MGFHTIGVGELWNMLQRSDIYLIDVRDRCDYRKFHIRGARNLPYDELGKWKNDLPHGKKIIIYCERGSSSMMAAKQLVRLRYDVYTLIGGICALNE